MTIPQHPFCSLW
jgi:hypothetical protein